MSLHFTTLSTSFWSSFFTPVLLLLLHAITKSSAKSLTRVESSNCIKRSLIKMTKSRGTTLILEIAWSSNYSLDPDTGLSVRQLRTEPYQKVSRDNKKIHFLEQTNFPDPIIGFAEVEQGRSCP